MRSTDVRTSQEWADFEPGRSAGHLHRAARPDRPATAVAVDALGALIPTGLLLAAEHGTVDAWPVAALTAACWLAIGTARGRYSRVSIGESGALRPVLHEWAVLVGLLAVLRAFSSLPVAALPVLLALVAPLLVTCLRRKLTQRRLFGLHRRGLAVRRTLVVGDAAAVDAAVGQLARHTHHEYVVVGACLIGPGEPAGGTVVAGRLTRRADGEPDGADGGELLRAAGELRADTVLAAPGAALSGERLRRLVWAVHESGRRLTLLPGITEVAVHRIALDSAGGLPLLTVAAPAQAGFARLVKAVTDRLGALVLLVLLSPLLLALALLVRSTSRGPAFHRQTRVGRGGETFTMVKFRSMVADADERRPGLGHLNEQDGRMFKIRTDPRVTRVGAVLRRFSLDELPQLLHVLTGRMSLVGPRPPVPEEVAGYDEVELRRLLVRPGLTGPWQVGGRSDLTWDETVAIDLGYVDNWSLAVDLHVLTRTVRAVAEGRGAY
ncbi:exopolysaccharide biosynthesis polyprenyl glycosylphosphotransferase [Streptomyces sp. SL13]|uniref:Exopolysaccharide biosynthesis polyprenyl glycosylphosphotransferase n=1 Tax=Streptantibioticus silvisoli TaxID=2705255 RepID=A0AA90JWG0_9ACTN|nr:exopolysaccharide biosynthesis polyprenyl glycosylphosphotransferase [Streptantibioticus silvisoli]MDI5964410.1 exopolysaccharide biosynthesis polyprenyl glycosylphosphotransferase [Streptantibioticus silvisoli]MDI5969056.1 exopolysaccharide biosynthesis polyprenyl glycosylphosphotransferase [Streptantibioticus silvisoli]